MLSSRKRRRYESSHKIKVEERTKKLSKEAAAMELGVEAKRIHV